MKSKNWNAEFFLLFAKEKYAVALFSMVRRPTRSDILFVRIVLTNRRLGTRATQQANKKTKAVTRSFSSTKSS
jgi:hypothetical protein